MTTDLPTVQEGLDQMAQPSPPEEVEVAEQHEACGTHLILCADPARLGVVLVCPACLERIRKPKSSNQWTEQGGIKGP